MSPFVLFTLIVVTAFAAGQTLIDEMPGPGPWRCPPTKVTLCGDGSRQGDDYSNIRVPVLALLQFAATTEDALTSLRYQPKDDAERDAIDRFIGRSRVIFGRPS